MSSSSSYPVPSSSVGTRRARLPVTRCNRCGAHVVELTSNKAESRGKIFYRCLARDQNGNQCSFFKWQGEYAIWLIETGQVVPSAEEEGNMGHLEILRQMVEVKNALRDLNVGLGARLGLMESKLVYLFVATMVLLLSVLWFK